MNKLQSSFITMRSTLSGENVLILKVLPIRSWLSLLRTWCLKTGIGLVHVAGCGCCTDLQKERMAATEKVLASSAALKAAAQVRCHECSSCPIQR